MTGAPLVTVGIPVRNGAPHLAAAIESVLAQDYPHLEILISDNASTDATAEIAATYRKRDPRIQYFRQDAVIPAFDNFMFVLERARGEFFVWVAHDDSRSPDYVSGLLAAFGGDPSTVLCFGDLFVSATPTGVGQRRAYDFETVALGAAGRMRKAALMQCFHIYGLWRTAALRRMRPAASSWWPDLPLMVAAAWRGGFRYVPGPRFSYYEVVKSNLERAAYQDNTGQFRHAAAVAGLFRATYATCASVGGIGAGLLGVLFVFEKQVRHAPGFFRRALKRRLRLT